MDTLDATARNIRRLVGGFVIVLGIGGIFLCLWVAEWDIERLRWPVAKAQVVSMDTRDTSDGEGLALEVPFATFVYQAGGRNYKQNANVGLATNSRSALESARRDFAPGSQVDVRFNPNDPSEIRPSPRVTGLALAALVLGAVISLCAVLCGIGVAFPRADT